MSAVRMSLRLYLKNRRKKNSCNKELIFAPETNPWKEFRQARDAALLLLDNFF